MFGRGEEMMKRKKKNQRLRLSFFSSDASINASLVYYPLLLISYTRTSVLKRARELSLPRLTPSGRSGSRR